MATRPRAEEWKWSSVRAHLAGVDDDLVRVKPLLDRVSRFADILVENGSEDYAELRRAEGTGRPLGTEEFIVGLEKILGRPIARRSPGRKAAPDADELSNQMSLLE